MVVLNKFSMWLLIEILSLNRKLFVMEFMLRECMCFYLSVWKHIKTLHHLVKLVHVYSFVKYIDNGRTLSALCMQCVCMHACCVGGGV